MTGSVSVIERVIVRLRETGYFGEVFGALEASAVEREFGKPAAVVYPAFDDSGENLAGRAGAIQNVRLTANVALSIPAPDDPHGEKAGGELAAAIEVTRGAILGWTPEDCEEPFRLVRGRLLEIEMSRVAWLEEYRTRTVISGGEGVAHV